MRAHFPGLNSLRFYAALCVVISHLENQFDTPPWFAHIISWLTLDAQSAVKFFFVLSGFLITYLLLAERSANGKINIRAFYLRRARRILPLYYLTVFIGLSLLVWLHGTQNLFAVISPGTVLALFLLFPNLTSLAPPLLHLWTIGVEEQYYFVWPWLTRRTRVLLQAIGGILLLKILLTVIVSQMGIPGMSLILQGLRFECMALGSFVAWLYFEKHRVLLQIYHPAAQLAAFGIITSFILIEIPLSLPGELISACAFAVLILNVATNPHSLLRLNQPLTENLGKISYGIYMYHFPVIFLCVIVFGATHLAEQPWYPIELYGATLSGTLVVAAISYRWFEQPILQFQRSARLQTIPEPARHANK